MDRQKKIYHGWASEESSDSSQEKDSVVASLKSIRIHVVQVATSLAMREIQSKSPQPGCLIPRQKAWKNKCGPNYVNTLTLAPFDVNSDPRWEILCIRLELAERVPVWCLSISVRGGLNRGWILTFIFILLTDFRRHCMGNIMRVYFIQKKRTMMIRFFQRNARQVKIYTANSQGFKQEMEGQRDRSFQLLFRLSHATSNAKIKDQRMREQQIS